MKRSLRHLITAVALVILGEVGVLNCNASSQQSSSPTNKTYDLIFVCPIIEAEYWQDAIEGIKKADKEAGTNTKVIGPLTSENFAQQMPKFFAEALKERPHGILAYSGLENLQPYIKEAKKLGIPLVAIDSDTPDDSNRVAFVGTDAFNSGYKAGEIAVDFVGENAKIGILVSSLSAQKEMDVINAFKDAASDFGMEVVAMYPTDAIPEIAASKVEEMMKEHPDIKLIFTTATYNVTGAARAKERLGLKDLVLLGFDDVPENLDFVRKGVINALFVQAPERMGYLGVHVMRKYLGTRELSSSSFDTGTAVVTKRNIDTYKNNLGLAVPKPVLRGQAQPNQRADASKE